MFDKNEKNEDQPEPAAAEELEISTIPPEFYGGANPVIKFREVQQVNSRQKPEMPQADRAPIVNPSLLANRKFLFTGAAALLIVFIAAVSFYYWYIGRVPAKIEGPARPPVNVPLVTTTAVVIETIEPPIKVETSTPAAPVVSSTIMQGGSIEFPSPLLGNAADTDRDGLTDLEEELYHTDPTAPDTDNDSFDDRTEIYNLYSPIDKAPTRLIASGLVKDYVNPAFNYKIYYPASWVVGNVDEKYRDVLFSTITGENIEVRVIDKDPGSDFESWFQIWAPGENLNALMNFSTFFKETGIARDDRLVFYFTDNAHVYVVIYHVTGGTQVNYRSTLAMMARSFRLPNNNTYVEDMKIYSVPSSTAPVEKVDLPE